MTSLIKINVKLAAALVKEIQLTTWWYANEKNCSLGEPNPNFT